MNGKRIWIVLATLIGFIPFFVTVDAAQVNNAPTDPALETAVRNTAAHLRDKAANSIIVSSFSTVQHWAFGMVMVPQSEEDTADPVGLLFLAQQAPQGWTVTIQYTDPFQQMLSQAPEQLFVPGERTLLTTSENQTVAATVTPQGDGSAELNLPWPSGRTMYLTGGPHSYVIGASTLGALDFGGPAGSPIGAARDGIAYHPCGSRVIIEHGGGWKTHYFHLTNIPIAVGQRASVSRMQRVGDTSKDSGCEGGSATGAHVHFYTSKDGVARSINGMDIGGWTIQQGSQQYAGCMVRIRDGFRRCSNNGAWTGADIFNDGTIGSGSPIIPCDASGIGRASSRQHLFNEAYNRKGGKGPLGCPINDAHWWGSGDNAVVIQDFRGGSAGDVAIIHDEKRDDPQGFIPAYVIHGGIWGTYRDMGGPDSWLGPPTSDEFQNTGGQPQVNFRSGYIVWDGSRGHAHSWSAPNGQWRAEYRNGHTFNSYPTLVHNEESISHDWGNGAPGGGAWGVRDNYFFIRWTKRQHFDAGAYKFVAGADDGIRVWVDGNLVIDQWKDQGYTEYTAWVTLDAREHDLKVEYYERDSGAAVRVWWEGPNRAPTAPALGAPVDGSTVNTADVTLQWQAATDPDNWPHNYLDYSVEIWKTDSSWRANWEWHPETSWALEVPSEGKYQWHVRSGDGQTASDWSSTWSFTYRQPPPPQSDLRPFAPDGYAHPVVPSSVQGTREVNTLYAGQPTYFDWHFVNHGAAASGPMEVALWVDDTRHILYPYPSVDPGQGGGFDDWKIDDLTPGPHKVRLVVDPDNEVAEADETNNVWEQIFTWEPPQNPLPAAPSNLDESASTPNSITLTWQDNSNNENGFHIYRQDGSSTEWRRVASVAANTTTFTDADLTCGSQYTYKVSAYNGAGEVEGTTTLDTATNDCITTAYWVFVPATTR